MTLKFLITDSESAPARKYRAATQRPSSCGGEKKKVFVSPWCDLQHPQMALEHLLLTPSSSSPLQLCMFSWRDEHKTSEKDIWRNDELQSFHINCAEIWLLILMLIGPFSDLPPPGSKCISTNLFKVSALIHHLSVQILLDVKISCSHTHHHRQDNRVDDP